MRSSIFAILDWEVGSTEKKNKKLHSHSCFPFVSVVGTIVGAASTSFGCWSATCSCTHTVPFWDWSVYQTCFYCTGFWEHVFSKCDQTLSSAWVPVSLVLECHFANCPTPPTQPCPCVNVCKTSEFHRVINDAGSKHISGAETLFAPPNNTLV